MDFTFDSALDHVLKTEGLWVNHPADKGGPTMRGITAETFQRYYGYRPSNDELRHLTEEQTRDIYREFYWKPLSADALPSVLAFVLFDQAVNWGVHAAAKRLQLVIGISADGIIGPMTIAAIRALGSSDLTWRYIRASSDAYMQTVQKNASQAVFLRGWNKRTLDLIEAVYRPSV